MSNPSPTRWPLDPVPGLRLFSHTGLLALDPTMELHDALAAGGHPIPVDVIRRWHPDRFFEALCYARSLRDHLSGSVDEPEKPEWLP